MCVGTSLPIKLKLRQHAVLGFLVGTVLVSSFFSLEVNRWLLAALSVLIFGAFFFSIRTTADRLHVDLLDLSLFVFLMVGILSSWFSGSLYESVTQWNWLLLYALVFWIARRLASAGQSIRVLQWSVFSTIVLFAAIAIRMWLANPATRLGGLLQNPNAAGPFLLVGAIIGVSLIASMTGRRRGFAAAGTTLIALAFLLTSSYTAWAAAAVTGLIAAIMFRRKLLRTRAAWVAAGGIAAVVLLGFLMPALLKKQSNASPTFPIIPVAHVESSFNQRLEFNRVAIEEFLSHPAFGVGLSQYQSVYPRYAATIVEQPRYTHNYYLQTLAEVGLFGALAFGIFLFFLVRRTWQVLRGKPDSGHVSLNGLALAVIASALASAVDFSWQFPAVFLAFWVLSGALMSDVRFGRPITLHIHPAVVRVSLTVLALAFLVRGVTLVYSQMEFDRAVIAIPRGEFDRAVSAYDQGVRFDPDPAALRERAWLQLLLELPSKRFDRTEVAIRELLRWNSGDYFAHHIVGRIRFVQDRYPEAEAAYRRALALDPKFHPDFAYDLGFLSLKQDRLPEARTVAVDMLGRYTSVRTSSNPKLATQLASLEYLLGEIAFREGKFFQAAVHFRDALDRDPNFLPAQQRLQDAESRVDAS